MVAALKDAVISVKAQGQVTTATPLCAHDGCEDEEPHERLK
jgi:hypothetical protein